MSILALWNVKFHFLFIVNCIFSLVILRRWKTENITSVLQHLNFTHFHDSIYSVKLGWQA